MPPIDVSGFKSTLGAAAVFLGAMLGSHTSANAAEGLRLASDPWAPFTDVAGKPRVALEIVETALREEGIAAGTRIVPSGDLSRALESGDIDGSAALWRDEAREKVLLFSEPYLENRMVLIGRRGATVDGVDFEKLKGKTVALVTTWAYGIDEKTAGPTFVRGPDLQANLDALLAGKVDFMVVDDIVAEFLLERYQEESYRYLAIGRTPVLRRPLHFAVRRTVPDAERIIEAFNSRVRTMIKDGSYNRILSVNWIRADVDGDGVEDLVLGGTRAGTAAPTAAYGVYSAASDAPRGAGAIYVDGTRYATWAEVPDEYKVPELAEVSASERDGVPLLDLTF